MWDFLMAFIVLTGPTDVPEPTATAKNSGDPRAQRLTPEKAARPRQTTGWG